SERHVGNESQPHSFAQSPDQLFAHLLLIDLLNLLNGPELSVPVAFDSNTATFIDEQMCRRQFSYLLEHRMVRRGVLIGKITAQASRLQLRAHARMGKQSFRLGGKEEISVRLGVVERLSTETIPCQHQALSLLIPQSKSKHAVEMFDAVFTVLFVG